MTQKTWIGGTYGLFLTGSLWSPGGIPGATDDVVIDTATTDVAIADSTGSQYITVDSVGLLAGDTLSIGAANTFSILDSGSVSSNAGLILLATDSYRNNQLNLAGDFVNSGTVMLTGTIGQSIYFSGPAATLSGGGTIALSDPNDFLLINPGVTLDNADNLIVGSGRLIGEGATSSLVNAGTIDGTGTGYGLVFQQTGFLTNTNLIEATSPQGLSLSGTVFNAGGTIAASGSGASLLLNDADIFGGTLASSGGAALLATYRAGTLDGVLNTGTIVLATTAKVTPVLGLANSIVNQGTIIVGGGTLAELSIASPVVTLTGGGTLELLPVSGGVRIVSALLAGASLDNVDNLITGAGALNYGYTSDTPTPLAVTNSGVIDASLSGKVLTISVVPGVTNTGLIEATAGAELSIEGVNPGGRIATTTLVNTGGTIGAFGAGAGVELSGVVQIIGGTLATGGGGSIYLGNGGVTLDGSGTHPITITAGSTLVGSAFSVALVGFVDDAGTLTTSQSVALSGTLEVDTGGRVSIGGGLGGSLAGTIALESGAVVTLGSAVAATQTVAFGGIGDVLVLSQPGNFSATLSGFASGDTIDLAGITATATLNGNAVALFTGTSEIGTIALAGFAGGTLAAATDGHGGTDITLQVADSGVKTWIGPAAGSFLTAADWSPSGVPGATDEVIIDSGADVTANSPALAIDSLFLTGGNTLAVAGGSFSILGTATSADPSGTSFNAGSITVVAAALGLAGTLHQSGAIAVGAGGQVALAAGADIAGGTLTLAAASLLTSSGGTVSGGGTLALSGGAVVSGSGLDNFATILGAGSLGDGSLSLVNEAAGLIAATNGLLTVDAGAGTIANSGVIAAENFPLNLDAGSLRNSGTVAAFGTVSGPTLTVAAATEAAGTLSGGTWIAASATLALGGSPITDDAAALTLSGSTAAVLSGPAGSSLEQSLLRIDPGGTLDLTTGRVFATGEPLVNAGTLVLAAGGLSATGTAGLVNQGLIIGNGAITGSISNAGTIAATGGVLTLGPLAGAGTVLVNGGSLVVTGTAAGGTIDFAGPGQLTVDSAGLFSDAVAGLAYNDVIDLANVAAIGSIAFDPVGDVLSLYTVSAVSTGAAPKPALAATVTLSGSFATPHFTVRTDSGGRGTDIVLPCFLAGTQLLTTAGEVPVEHLRVGDIAITRSGQQPIIWIGDRRVSCERHPRPALIRPVRIVAGAFGKGRPARDLLLSPDHAVAWDDVLIPVKHLINGATVVQERPSHAHYFHVELARHDVVLSDGLWTESYLDTGNRSAFANGGAPVALHPDFAPRHWDNACAELVTDGPRVIAVRQRLFERAGIAARRPPLELRVLAEPRELVPEVHARGIWRFTLPPSTRALRLLSPAWVPAEHCAASLDRRQLGVRLLGVAVDGVTIGLDDAALFSGFHALEDTAEGICRWTNGDARLVVSVGAHTVMLEIGDDAYLSDRVGVAASTYSCRTAGTIPAVDRLISC